MSPKSKQVLEAALELPEAERAAVAERLLESMDLGLDESTDGAWAAEIERRIQEIETGAVKTIPWSQIRAELERGQDGEDD